MEKNKINFLYVLPNLFTASSIFLGVLSVMASVNGDFIKAGWFIIVATVFDALDGRVARLTNTTSKFGEEFDSLADVITFGVAPGFLVYFAYGMDFGRLGILATALYIIFGAVRLARFNVMVGKIDSSIFLGIPIPSAALFLVSWALILQDFAFLRQYEFIIVIWTILAGILMVSNIRYPGFKKVNFKKAYFIRSLIALIVVLSLVFIYPIMMLCLISTTYIMYGLIRYFFMITKKVRRKEVRDE
jgi:CDP-diacylglycerol--serine O-phosphatidyltransferase